MKMLYLANVRMPTEKAHGVAIAKACEAFANAGVKVELVIPHRRTPIDKTIFEAYGVKENFSVEFLPTVDLITEKSGQLIFWLQTLSFQLSLFFYLLFKSRKTLLYTRDPSLIPLKLLGYKLVYECHHIQKKGLFFSFARMASRLVVISGALKKTFIAAGFSEADILVAPSGVDLSIFDIEATKESARKELELPQHGTIAVYTGNFTTMGQDKGISDILKALVSAPDILFVAVGGSDKDRARYTHEAEGLNIADRISLKGSSNQRVLALYQKAADVLLMPFPDTPHYRNHMSPVKMFEYMAAKRPIIASDLPTIREVLNEQNAILVPPGNPEELAEILNKFSRGMNTDAIAELAYRDVKKYSWSSRTERVLSHIGK